MDPVLSEFHFTEDSNGTKVYYTILEDNIETIDDPAILNLDNSELLGDNVFYLSIDDEQDQNIIEDEDIQEIQPTFPESVFEEITLPDGSHAYLKNDTNIEMIDEDNLLIQGSSHDILENSSENNDPLDNLLTTDDTDERYEQVQLEDGTYAIIESSILKSFMEQSSQLKTPISKEVTKAYDCPYKNCNKAYTTRHHLRVHMRIHTGQRPYKCKFEGCDKALSTGYSLKTHLRTHTGEKPYSCQMCSKSFKTSGDLQKHIRIHTGEKPFVCPIDGCGKSFTTSNIRKVHIRSHTGERPYVCEVEGCEKAFASATNYKNHMRIHSGEKPYLCSIEGCGKRFTEYSSLYKHNLVHSNNKTVKCEYCGKALTHTSLISHKRSAHNVIIMDDGTEIMLQLDSNDLVLAEPTEQHIVVNLI